MSSKIAMKSSRPGTKFRKHWLFWMIGVEILSRQKNCGLPQLDTDLLWSGKQRKWMIALSVLGELFQTFFLLLPEKAILSIYFSLYLVLNWCWWCAQWESHFGSFWGSDVWDIQPYELPGSAHCFTRVVIPGPEPCHLHVYSITPHHSSPADCLLLPVYVRSCIVLFELWDLLKIRWN